VAKAREAHRLLLQVADEVLDEDGKLVVITHHPEWLEMLMPVVDFVIERRYEVMHGDLPAAILVIRRKSNSNQSAEVHES
jgi:hypothetical protein